MPTDAARKRVRVPRPAAADPAPTAPNEAAPPKPPGGRDAPPALAPRGRARKRTTSANPHSAAPTTEPIAPPTPRGTALPRKTAASASGRKVAAAPGGRVAAAAKVAGGTAVVAVPGRQARRVNQAAAKVSGVPLWRPVRGGNAFEITVSRLAQAIRLGLVGEGDRLPAERELAERLQVSRVTLREAIRALREAGYLESRRGRTGGTFVISPVTTTEIDKGPKARPKGDAAELARQMGDTLHDALDFRRVLEPGAAGLAATRTLAAVDRQHLVACLAASRDRDPTTRRVADSRLHLAIAAASGSPSLAAAVADVQLTLDGLLASIPVIKKNLDHSDRQHARVVDAILAGDALAARATMEQHCDATAELLRGLLG
jgi:DNA-binding FadR family transcriptional regulator